MIHIKTFVFNPFMENTYVVHDDSGEAVIIDPGCYEQQEKEMLTSYVKSEDLKVVRLLNTHCHVDHVLGNDYVMRTWQVPLSIHPLDEPVLRAVETYAPSYGFASYQKTAPDDYLQEGTPVSFGDSELEVLFTPGHAPGHVVFFHRDSFQVIGGDVLFRESIGRTDLPGGNHAQLIDSIHQKLFPLPDHTTVYPGHGEPTTIGHEKKVNPFCKVTS